MSVVPYLNFLIVISYVYNLIEPMMNDVGS